ncbi:hypothetical protein NX059_008147 [Plenodomus lindquistii]|nr:hypothetical protein NX059_008147 [Plenodomus lindquistii]
MFHATAPLQKMLRRLPLSPKQAGKEYYKGNRVGSLGKIDKYGNFSPDWSKIRTFVPPAGGLEAEELTPFVAASLPPRITHRRGGGENYPKYYTGKDYLRDWKQLGGHDEVAVHDDYAQSQGAQQQRTNMPEPGEGKEERKEESMFMEKEGGKGS